MAASTAGAAEVKEGPMGFPLSPVKRGGKLLTPIATSLAALLTPHRLAAPRDTLSRFSSPLLQSGGVRMATDPHSSPDERELLRFKCTLLELELQAKETVHAEEREKWEGAVCSAEGVHTAMGEVEARVRQVTASTNKVRGLLHEMHRMWCTSLALEDQWDSGADVDEAADELSLFAVTGEGRPLRRHPSNASTPVSDIFHRSPSAGVSSSASRRSPENAGSGREFFGIERHSVF